MPEAQARTHVLVLIKQAPAILWVYKNTERLDSAQAITRVVVLDEYSLYSLYSTQYIG